MSTELRTLADLCDGRVDERLRFAGFEPSTAAQIANMFVSSAQRLKRLSGAAPESPARAFWVPGRIEVLGKHTDYAGGRSLLGAVTRGFAIVAADRADARFRLFAAFVLAGGRAKSEMALSAAADPAESWAAYPAAARRVP